MKNLDLLKIILKWKYKLLIVAVLAAVLAAVFSSPFFIHPKYKSYAVIYPINIMPYGLESPTEQMLQVLQSDTILNHLAKKFNLVKHYELDSLSPALKHDLLAVYKENVSIRKTEYEAVKIEALDTDPVFASEMIKEMISVFNSFNLELNRSKSKELMRVSKKMLDKKQMQIDSINLAIKELAVKYGLIDYEAQSRELAKEYYRTVSTGSEKKIADLTNAMRNLEEKGARFHELQKHLKESTREYGTLLAKYNLYVSDSEKEITYTNIVARPFPADKKAYPVRWVIVTISTCLALFFALMIIMIVEGKKTQNPSLSPHREGEK